MRPRLTLAISSRRPAASTPAPRTSAAIRSRTAIRSRAARARLLPALGGAKPTTRWVPSKPARSVISRHCPAARARRPSAAPRRRRRCRSPPRGSARRPGTARAPRAARARPGRRTRWSCRRRPAGDGQHDRDPGVVAPRALDLDPGDHHRVAAVGQRALPHRAGGVNGSREQRRIIHAF